MVEIDVHRSSESVADLSELATFAVCDAIERHADDTDDDETAIVFIEDAADVTLALICCHDATAAGSVC